ncbi:MAG: hypothetical protein J5994_10725 [Ruminococcus sp.]|nr:hypothetical protein [Ruminococcus sp.]
MTNQKFKGASKNIAAHLVINANAEMLAILILVLNKHYPKQLYPKRVLEYINSHGETVKEMDEFTDDGIFDYKSDKLGERYNISDDVCKSIIKYQIVSKYKRTDPVVANNLIVLYKNLKFMLITLCSEFGFGAERTRQVIGYLRSEKFENPLGLVKARFDIDLSVPIEAVDYRKFKPKKQRKATYSEGVQAQRNMAALKAYQDEILKGVQNSETA